MPESSPHKTIGVFLTRIPLVKKNKIHVVKGLKKRQVGDQGQWTLTC